MNFRDFFNNFSNCCSVKYDPIDFKPQEVKRKLAPLLETKKKSLQIDTKIQSREESTTNKMSEM
jgi:hypothetical protein